MATRYEVLGQVAPIAATDTTLYTVPALKEVVVSTLVIANRDATPAVYRIAIRPAGANLEDKHYIAYDIVVGSGDSTTITVGLTLAAADVITVRGSSADLSFAAFGSVIDL